MNKMITWRGLSVKVEEIRDPSSEPWDGEEPLGPGAEGYDLALEVELDVDGQIFKAQDSICGNWIYPNQEGYAYLDSEIESLTEEALSSLEKEVARVASGEDVRKAEARKLVAMVVSGLPA